MITTAINTVIHLTAVVIMQTSLLNFLWWKKASAASLILPYLVGYILWIIKDTPSTRIIYLWCLYTTYVLFLVTAIVEFVLLLLDYLTTSMVSDRTNLIVIGSFIGIYGIAVLFLNLSFGEYHWRKTEEEVEQDRLAHLLHSASDNKLH